MNSLGQLLEFLLRLQNARVHYRLDCVRDAIMVIVPTPSKYYEVEFFADGHVESQTFEHPSTVADVTLETITASIIRDVNG